MTELDLDAIKARTNAATPAPWRVTVHEPSLTRMVLSEDHTLDIDFGYVGNCTQRDAEFVAHARQDVPALVAEAERLRAAEQRVRAAHPMVDDGYGPECRGCGNPVAGIVTWPCPTIRALDGGETP